MRILAFCIANQLDYTLIGYTAANVVWLQSNIHRLALAGDQELEHTFHQLSQQGFTVKGQQHDHIEQLHFDAHSSDISNVPLQWRNRIYPLLLGKATGIVQLTEDHQWQSVDLHKIS